MKDEMILTRAALYLSEHRAKMALVSSTPIALPNTQNTAA